jgi:methionyl-tRNA formyltransferase
LCPTASGPPGTILETAQAGIVVACGTQALALTTLQLEGGKRLGARQFLGGHSLAAGTRLGMDPDAVGDQVG